MGWIRYSDTDARVLSAAYSRKETAVEIGTGRSVNLSTLKQIRRETSKSRAVRGKRDGVEITPVAQQTDAAEWQVEGDDGWVDLQATALAKLSAALCAAETRVDIGDGRIVDAARFEQRRGAKVRSMRRRVGRLPAAGAVRWEVETDSGWADYSGADAAKINEAYRWRRPEAAIGTGRVVDLTTFEQRRIDTGKVRSVRAAVPRLCAADRWHGPRARVGGVRGLGMAATRRLQARQRVLSRRHLRRGG